MAEHYPDGRAIPEKLMGFRVYVRGRWRYANLDRVITRGKHKGKVEASVPLGLEGFQKFKLSPAEITCTCCGLMLTGAVAGNVAGGGVTFSPKPLDPGKKKVKRGKK